MIYPPLNEFPYKSLLIGMLACTALVGCTDEVLEDNNNQSQQEKVRAYVNLTINTATNSSRSEGGNGDTDGNSEHSGHENNGTTAENQVKQIMYILAHQQEDDGIIVKNGEKDLSQTFQVQSIGNYDALVVINPTSGLLSTITETMTPREAYNAVLNYSYTATENTNDLAMGAYTANGFMMANQTAVSIPVSKANNSEATAASGVINVERAISKITFRKKAADASAGTPANTYPVTIIKEVYNPITCPGWYISAKSNDDNVADTYSYDTFNSANNGDVWVRVKKGLNPSDLGQVLPADYSTTFEGIYKRSSSNQDYTGYVNNTATPGYVFTPIESQPARIVLDKGAKKEGDDGTKTETYYVKLENYALTNLSKSIYGVRHKTTDWTTFTALGQLASTENLVDPQSVNKNKEIITDTWNNGGTYFYNDLATVTTEAESMSTGSTATLAYFKDLNLEDQDPQGVTNENSTTTAEKDGSTHKDATKTDVTEIGQFMSYCFENAVNQEKQVNGLVTGIIFAGQIYTDAACKNAVDVMYKYKGSFYRELRDLLANNASDTALKDLTEYSTDEQAAAVEGLDVYKGGKCFYYANEIKHFDNNNPTERGIMEFAIMRNNIYSLKINTISEIGSSTVEPTVSDPAEDEGAYITMQARILPWIVRFNDIEF